LNDVISPGTLPFTRTEFKPNVPHHAETLIRQGIDAWSQLQDRLRELAALNKERLIPAKPKK
jgi:hypothetical protein